MGRETRKGMGTQQMVKLSVDIQKLFNIGPKAKK